MRKKIVLFLSMLMLVAATAATQGCFVENPNGGYGYSGSGRWHSENSYRGWRGWRPGPGHYNCDRYGNNCTQS